MTPMSSIPEYIQKLVRGMKRTESSRPEVVSQAQWDGVAKPAMTKKDVKYCKSSNTHLLYVSQYANADALQRYVREQRDAMGVGHYPLRERWACKPEGMAVSLPHFKFMEEPYNEGDTIKLRSEKTPDTH